MDRRDDVLRQALDKNADETDRWEAFKADNEVAIKNLDMFSKQLSVEVMVPIGKKALMPGALIHTNELLVGHYQGYFSACSAYKAKEICQHRLRLAEEHLKKLGVEADLWQNKLEMPLLEGAVPNAGEIEIVEDYDEEAHIKWLKEHKESVRKEKQEERIQREAHANDDDELTQLKERELLKELGLDNFSQQAIGELLNVDADIPESEEDEDCDKQVQPELSDEQVYHLLDKLEAQEQGDEVEIDPEAEQNLQSTKELVQNLMKGQMEVTASKTRIGKAQSNFEQVDEYEESIDEDESDQPEEVTLIREQMFQLPIEEQAEFLKDQLEIIKSKMRKIQKEHFINDELTHLMNVVVCLEDDLQEMLSEQIEVASTDELSDQFESLPDTSDNKKRKISFAECDHHLVFRKEEPVDRMLRKSKKLALQSSRDVISLDEPLKPAVREVIVQEPPKPVTSQIMQKVEQNLEFVKEHQSVQDFDLVNQILEASTGQINTLHISFKHSDAEATSTDFDGSTPGNPADFYSLYEKAQAKAQVQTKSEHDFPIYVNSFKNEEELKVPILKEEARNAAYNDPRSQFSKPSASAEAAETKSILRNKTAAEHENRDNSEISEPQQATIKTKRNRNKKKKQRTIEDDLRDMSAYQKVMHDLVEKEPTIPEPLPEGKYIDANAPKKRISRFKEQRSSSKS